MTLADAQGRWRNDEIARRLRSAVDTLTPDVLERIDLNTPQERYREKPVNIRLYRRFRRVAGAAAACLAVAAFAGGVAHYQNTRVDSIIGLDVNPSIELSVNRQDKILKAEALNQDAVAVLDDMDLEQVDLNIGVNAIIGSMVRHGYLDNLDNAILVTVSNDDSDKASVLRQDVVSDIEISLEAHKVSAVVYDQQATDADEIRQIAEEYDISYGKACFLQELVEENGLSEEDLASFADMTMEEIAKEITESSYQIGGKTEGEKPSASETEGTRESASETQPTESSALETTAIESQTEPSPTARPSETAESSSAPDQSEESKEETGRGKAVKIDNTDFYEGVLDVTFKDKVRWKNPAVSVTDSSGISYSARITDTGSDSCSIEIRGLPGNEAVTFTLSGVKPRDGGSYGSVTGYFDTPDIGDGAMGDENWEEEETEEEDQEEEPAVTETDFPETFPVETIPPAEQKESQPPKQQTEETAGET